MAVQIISTSITNATDPNMLSLFKGNAAKVVLRFTSDSYPVKKISIVDGSAYGVEDDIDDPVDGVYTYVGTITANKNQAHYELIDDRGIVVFYSYFTLPILEYYNPDFHISYTDVDYDYNTQYDYVGHTTVTVHAAWWNELYRTVSDGQTRNRLTISAYYRDMTANQPTWTLGIEETNFVNSNYDHLGTYTKTFQINNMPYGHAYAVRVFIKDDFFADQKEEMIVGSSIFDWSSQDFRFNVPVNCERSITFAKGAGLSAESGKQLLTYDDQGNLYIGLGNYNREDGTTYICGDDIQFLSNQTGVTLDMRTLWRLNSAMTNSFNLNVTTRLTGGGTIPNVTPSCTAILRGNNLYIRFRCVSNSGPITSSTGDLSDIYLATLTINHGGRIADFDDVISSISTSGTLAGLELRKETNGETQIVFDVYMTSNTQGATSTVYTTFNVPVTLNLNYY